MLLADYLANVATVYLSHSHEPYSVTVRKAYEALKLELLQQYRMLRNGLTVEHVDVDPYDIPEQMFEDISRNRHLSVYTYADLPFGHPLSAMNLDYKVRYNDIFRAVHDGLAHYPGRHSFSMHGEYRAYKAHCTFLSPMARWAIASETIGQSAVVFCGPESMRDRFAPQKATLLPRDLVSDNIELEDI